MGRGPIAGPVVAGAVVLPDLSDCHDDELTLLRDSKTLTPSQLERADQLVRRITTAVGIGEVSSSEIDRIGIAPAVRKAMRRALEQLAEPSRSRPRRTRSLSTGGVSRVRRSWKGDALCMAISAASIVAKVYRDALMRSLDDRYPGYGLGSHKGYASAEHLAAVAARGPSPVHRLSFSPFKPTLFAVDA